MSLQQFAVFVLAVIVFLITDCQADARCDKAGGEVLDCEERCCGSYDDRYCCLWSDGGSAQNSQGKLPIILGCLFGVVTFVLIVSCCLFCAYRKRKGNSVPSVPSTVQPRPAPAARGVLAIIPVQVVRVVRQTRIISIGVRGSGRSRPATPRVSDTSPAMRNELPPAYEDVVGETRVHI